MTRHGWAEDREVLEDSLSLQRDTSETEETDTQTFRHPDIQDSQDSQDSQDLHDTQEETEAPHPDTSLPLTEYAAEAEHYSRSRYSPDPHWVSPTWHFSLAMKRHPELSSVDDGEFFGAIPFSATTWTETERLAIRIECRKVHSPFCNQLELAAEIAESRPLRWDDDSPLYDRFASTAGWLQVLRGDKTILLPCTRMGRLLGVDQRVISHMRERAEQEGLLKLVKKHSFKKGQATEFRFRVEAFSELQEDD